MTSAAAIATKQRVSWIEGARTIAALLVVMVHMPLNTEYDYVDTVFLSAHVPLFFLLSGYFFKWGCGWVQTLKRIAFLAIPYLLWNALTYWFLKPAIHAESAAGHFITIVFRHPDMPTWFLRNLLIYMVLLALLPTRKWAAAVACLLLATVYGGFLPGWFPLHERFLAGAGLFLAGASLQWVGLQAIHAFLRKTRLIWLSLGVGCSVVAAAGQLYVIEEAATCLIGCMGLLALAVVVDETRLGPWVARCGEATFLLFVLHYPIILLCGWDNSIWMPEWNYGYTVLFAVGCLVLSVGVISLLKRWCPSALPYVAALKNRGASEARSSATSVCTQPPVAGEASVSKGRG